MNSTSTSSIGRYNSNSYNQGQNYYPPQPKCKDEEQSNNIISQSKGCCGINLSYLSKYCC